MSMMSETEKAYRNMLGESNELREPMSRKEKLLHKMLGEDIELEPPQSIEEELLLEVIINGVSGGSGSSVAFIHFEWGEYDSELNGEIVQSDKTFEEIFSIVTSGNPWIAELSWDDGEQTQTIRSCTAFPDGDNPNNIGIEFRDTSTGEYVPVFLSPTYMYIPNGNEVPDTPVIL